MNAPLAFPGQRVDGEPRRLRHEWAWTLALPDGRRAVLAQLVPELAADPALRRRWVADMERLAALPAAALAPTLLIGPAPDPRAADAEPPWRVRVDPAGPTLAHVLERAPLPVDEAIELVARLAAAVQSFHAAGAILRDLDPRMVVLGDDGQVWFTDVGHARLAILSSRTASSLLLESSPYVASEAMLGTVVDARADVYSLGVVLWRALTGRVPFEASLLSSRTQLPKLRELRPEVPAPLEALAARCLEHEPERRPPTARDVAEALRGKSTDTALAIQRIACQACGAPMRTGLRLCLACGRQAVQFHRAAPDDPDAVAIVLDKAREDAPFVAHLHDFYASVAEAVPRLNFVVGDIRMYSKSEVAQRHRTPTILVDGLAPETGTALVAKLKREGFAISTTTPRARRKAHRRTNALLILGGAGVVGGAAALGTGAAMAVMIGVLALGLGVLVGFTGFMHMLRERRAAKRVAIGRLRATPAALPAGDELVAKIAEALAAAKSPDVRARLEEIALLVQRLSDAKAARDHVEPLVELARGTADAIESIDHQLASLDEGAIVRALARCEARNEAPALKIDLLAGLDTLRKLEEQRAALFGRLLEITSLARTVAEQGLRAAAALSSDDVEVAHALAALSE